MTLSRPVLACLRYLAMPVAIWTTANLSGQTAVDAVRPFWGICSPGGRASGLAQAFTGIADDATAITFNPAGLAHLTAGEFNISFGHLKSTTDVTEPANHSSTSIAATRLGNLGLVVPIPHTRFTWAAAYQLVRAYDRRWENTLSSDPQVHQSITEEGSMGAYSVAVAYQASPQLAIGAVLDLLAGNSDYSENITFTALPDSNDFAIIKPDYRGINLGLGLLLAPIPRWRIGLLLRTPQKINVKELYTDITLNDWKTYNYSARSSYYLRSGTSLSLGPWLLAADIYWFDYSQIEFESDLYDGGKPIDLEINQILRSSYNSIIGWAIGAELLLPRYNVKLRGGYRLDPAFYRSKGYDADQQTFALGFSLVPVPALKLDFTYTRTSWENNLYESLTADNLALGLAYRL